MSVLSTARGRAREPLSVTLLLVGTAVAYLINLASNGWANSFYSAAVQAGSVSWKAGFFGSSDAANSITVDKPPAALWLMELSVRVFGLSGWSILVPQVLLGVASVGLLYATVRRYFGHPAGLLAGLLLAVTPVAVLMFRFNNPDALLVFLMIAAVWAMMRAVEDGRTRWMLLVGVFVGFGFLTKQLQVLLVIPPVAVTYLIAGPAGAGKRLAQLVGSAAAAVVSAGWWIAAVELWPPGSRPWIGGSPDNSILELTLGYNGLGRINGNETGSASGPREGMYGFGGHFGSEPGIGRLFQPALGGQIAWLLPTALLLAILGIVLLRNNSRTDARRAVLIVFGLWILTTGIVFSYMQGIFHPYYSMALTPAVAALVGAGSVLGWREREKSWVRACLAALLMLTAAMEWLLLGRSPEFQPWLRWAILILALLALIGLAMSRCPKAVVVAALVAALAGPVAYSAATIATPHGGALPSAGPEVNGGGFPEFPDMPERPHRAEFEPVSKRGGSLLDGSDPGPNIVAALNDNADRYTWVAAAIGSNQASGYQLATRRPVMPIGGFNGTDPSPTLAQFQQYVADGQIHYFIDGERGSHGGEGFGPPGSETSKSIREWVQRTFTKKTIDDVEVYDLTGH
ncbi:Probable glycosyltransferase [Mycobacteroides abscessus subsp. abscessus]|uniref:glycosyltransferase family 39 protein n=1 Tax=Mycobacteroides abscessus TaxID=36809 RepID=UPI0009288FA0|nr:glycosyltransferase family 39 protein [Mycobacteroides abscessus]SHO86755.1 Probable glycosyltransferase [Mycobacteroides abscessus subsp. abscessus]SHP08370.1 Probable glycosyltransferase [Mycobacteroides abscessus subsp. abscessus]SHP62194.1 Probable glycosyltransferase [Mycobacteroides abscessus subsp. abscessus]SHP68895.1 Probable glycosyltransferase [Mycobacteroides abscessus subsp. abscessus]